MLLVRSVEDLFELRVGVKHVVVELLGDLEAVGLESGYTGLYEVFLRGVQCYVSVALGNGERWVLQV